MSFDYEDRSYSFMEPLCQAWLEKIEQARKAKQPFDAIAEQCDAFFSQAVGFMWRPKFKSKFIGSTVNAPKFQVTISKAFELVALFGPTLYWQYPQRVIRSEKPLEYDPSVLQDERVQEVLQRAYGNLPTEQLPEVLLQKQQQDYSIQQVRNRLMERYLNYSQMEMPGGGLATHSELAITEALVKGRGCLWAETYSFPGSGRTLTGMFYDTVDNLLVDPDCDDPTLTNAAWICRRHVTPVWKLEQKFDLATGSLSSYAQYESANGTAARQRDVDKQHRRNGQTNDLIVWYEIWSKGGVGTRLSVANSEIARTNRDLAQGFDEVVGDHAYLCIAPAVPFPLNAPARKVSKASDEEVAAMFEWRASNYGEEFPCYLDDRWPVACLDFYKKYGSAWPIAPLAPGLGELVCLNILAAAFIEQAYDNRKSVIAYMQSAAATIKDAIQGQESPAFVELNDSAGQSIDQIVSYLNKPEMNKDIMSAIQFVSDLFDKRTGLTELLYAMNVGGAASRSARDVAVKEEKASVRPDKMAKDVATWQEQATDLEKFLAGWSVVPEHLRPLMGEIGVILWEAFIYTEDPEVVVREMRAVVTANDVRKPNKEREASNLKEMLGYTLPVLKEYAELTTDPEPLNNFLESIGDAVEQDVSKWRMQPWQPAPPSEEQQQMQQQAQQLEMAKLQAEVQGKTLDAQIKQTEAQIRQIEAEVQAATGGVDIKQKQMEFQFDAAKAQQKLSEAQAQSEQKLMAEEQRAQLQMKLEEQKAMKKLQLDGLASMQDLAQDEEEHEQDLTQTHDMFLMDLITQRKAGEAKIQQMKKEGQVKVDVARKSAAAKPATKPGAPAK